MAKQRASSSSVGTPAYRGVLGGLRTLLHLVAAVQFGYAIYYDWSFVEFPVSEQNMHNPFGGKFKYLTFLNAIIQCGYYAICLVNDFIGTNEVAPRSTPLVRKLKDYVMATFAFPIAFNVAITFWSLYAIDRELVFPRVLDAVFPSWLNHIMHTNIVVFMVLEMFTSFRVYPKRSVGIGGLSAFMIAYLVWIHVVKQMSGVWVYPVLEVLQLPQRIVFFAGVLGFTFCLYLFGEFANGVIWSKELRLASRKVR